MLELIEPSRSRVDSLDTYAADPRFAAQVQELRAEAALVAPRVQGTIWMVNSTARGGGVAEMMPTLLAFLRELGFRARWAVIGSDEPEFFRLTKRLHNMLHGQADGGIDLGPDEAALLETVGHQNARELEQHLGPGDVLFVHDPQPIALGSLLRRERGLPLVWRCHIGLDERTPATRAAWRFLRPFLTDYQRAIFSAPEYIPSYLAGRASIVYPGLDPHSHKNRDLSVPKMVGILCNGGLQPAHAPVPTPDYEQRARRVMPDGSLGPVGELGLLFRPIVLQVSRWDRLKGWRPLLDAFAQMRRSLARDGAPGLNPRNQQRLALSRLVLAGPDPEGVADDPEGQAVFDELREAYRALEPALQADVALIVLPMGSRKENALAVNALQRCATVVVQNSLREGFGLTATEAMWKRQAVLATHAVGLRHQIRDTIDGRLTRDPNDPLEIATHLRELLVNPRERFELGRNAHRRVNESFLVFTQLSRYIELIGRAVDARGTGEAVA
jgi:trehalose synthase